MSNCIVYAGTIGQGIWRSADGGETFNRACRGMFMESEIRAFAVSPNDDKVLFAGTDAGVYRTTDGGDNWESLNVPFTSGNGWQQGTLVWSLAINPHNPQTIYAGTCPSALYRSRDGGDSWDALSAEPARECAGIVYTRVTTILCDPVAKDTVWAGIEIDGAYRSDDGGDHWVRLDRGLSSLDIHGLAVVPPPKSPPSAARIIASTNNDLNISKDNGESWTPQSIEGRFRWRYCRGITQKADDPQTMFLGNGNGPPGNMGTIMVSRDGGNSWSEAEMSRPPNSTIWSFATHQADPNRVFACSVSGYVYRSIDAGQTWSKLPHEFGEVRALAWTPQ